MLSKALSAFANVAGGLLVLGVATVRGSNGVPDRADSVHAIPIVERFAEELRSRIVRATEPPIAGVQVEWILRPGTSEGVVLVLVPDSLGKPHRAIAGGTSVNDRYYMRTTTDSPPMPHAILAAMFLARPVPRLEVTFQTGDKLLELDREHSGWPITILVRNVGAIAALSLSMRLHIGPGPTVRDPTFSFSKPIDFGHVYAQERFVLCERERIRPKQATGLMVGLLEFTAGEPCEVPLEVTIWADNLPDPAEEMLTLRYNMPPASSRQG